MTLINDIKESLIRRPEPKKDFVLRVSFGSSQYAADVFTELIRLAARVDESIDVQQITLKEVD